VARVRQKCLSGRAKRLIGRRIEDNTTDVIGMLLDEPTRRERVEDQHIQLTIGKQLVRTFFKRRQSTNIGKAQQPRAVFVFDNHRCGSAHLLLRGQEVPRAKQKYGLPERLDIWRCRICACLNYEILNLDHVWSFSSKVPYGPADCPPSGRSRKGMKVVLMRFWFVLVMMLGPFVAVPSYAETPVAEAEVSEWICPMRCDDLRFDAPGDCPICGMHVVPHKVQVDSDFFGDSLFDDAERIVPPPQTALMPGLSPTHFYFGVGGLFVITLLLGLLLKEPRTNLRPTRRRWTYPRVELTWLRRFLKWRGAQFAMQVPVVAAFVLVIVAGLIGNQDPSRNIAPVLTWNIWWMGLIFFAFFAGQIWCTVCPWMAIPDWIARFGARLRGQLRPLGLHKKWPKKLKNLYIAIAFFLGVSWIELAYEAPYRPALTALMGLGMVGLAGLTLIIFEKKSFCRWVCPVGRVTGQYGTTGMLEIRRRDTDVCLSCKTRDCLHGNERGLPCPTQEFMGAMNENTYCTMCTECIRTCPHDNVALNVRAPLVDLMGPHRRRLDEAWLVLTILGITLFHGLAMIPVWTHDTVPPLREWSLATLGADPGYLVTFTAGMTLFMVALIVIYAAFCGAIRRASGNLTLRFKDFFIALSYTLLPLALGYHLAHNALHFFYEGSKLVRLISDPFGWGWNLFGTAENPLTMLVPIQTLWIVQVLLVLAAQISAIFLIRRALFRMLGNRRQMQRAFVVAALLLMVLSFASLWLLNQPMEMRTA